MSDSTNRHARVFPDLAPPPGGLASLRTKLARADRPDRRDRRDGRRARLLTLAFVPSLAAAAAVVTLFVTRTAPVTFDHDEDARHLAAEIAAQPALATPTGHVVAGATAAVPLADGATLYWVP